MILVFGLALLASACNDTLFSGLHVDSVPEPSPSVDEEPQPDQPPDEVPTPEPQPEPSTCDYYVIDYARNVYHVDVATGAAGKVSALAITAEVLDIAVADNGDLVAFAVQDVYRADIATGTVLNFYPNALANFANSGDRFSGGRFLAGGSNVLSVLEAPSKVQVLAELPGDWVFSGDVAYDAAQETVYASARTRGGSGVDRLWKYEIAKSTWTKIGPLDFSGVLGMDFACDGNLYGVAVQTSPPLLIEIDVATGTPREIAHLAGVQSVMGAASPD